MANLRQSFAATVWRGLKGMLVGAAVAAVIALAMVALPVGLQLFLFDAQPMDRASDLERLQKHLPLMALVASFVGSIAGFAARLPRNGIGIPRSFAVVGGCAVLAGLFTAVQPRYKGSPEPSHISIFFGAIVGGIIVLVYGILATMRSKAGDGPKPTDPPSGHGDEHE